MITSELRAILERSMDFVLKTPKGALKMSGEVLAAARGRVDLETKMSFVAGIIWGAVLAYYANRLQRDSSRDEYAELLDLVQRRLFEVRLAFLGAMGKGKEPSP